MKTYLIETKNACGRMLCHDITKIEKGGFKGALFKKGHFIGEKDIETLLDLGKNHIYVLELEKGDLHEDDAGKRIAEAICGPGLQLTGVSEGRVNLIAQEKGLLKIDTQRLLQINSIPEVIVSTLHSESPVEEREMVAGAKVIPLVVKEETILAVEEICAKEGPVTGLVSYQPFKIGALITGREVYEGRIKDGFAPVLTEKAARFDLDKPVTMFCPDDAKEIASSIQKLISSGCTFIIITGGMSVDPDDVTPSGICLAGASIVKYGAPALPGAMFLMAYIGDIPVIGLPACAMYFQNTVLDILMPRILAGQKISVQEIAALGHGGLCRRCENCFFPHCSFGKSIG